ncbi:MAG: TlpA family protein disulfide reductase [Acidobacteriaceae bacterium]|nr:TlpA family protein disulfide reductase [Acidobacteriaceae bacterium]
MRKSILLSLAAIAALASLVFADATENIRKAPELAFKIPGKPDQLLSQYRGKVVALEFIFTTCPHCQAASKYMTKMQADYGARGLQVIDVAINPNADLLVENFAKDMQVNFPVGWATADQMEAFMGFGNARYVVPQLALIDRQGNIHWQTPATSNDPAWEKVMNQDAIRQHIEQLLAQPATASAHRPPTKLAANKKPS